MAVQSPTVITASGSQITTPVRIMSIVWEGVTVSGDAVEVVHLDASQNLLWAARTDASQTYLGVAFGISGLPAPNGFKVTTLGNGRLLFYVSDY